LEAILFELELYQDVSGEHRELTRAWISKEQARASIPIVRAERALD
jgi:hypothetical protein